MGASRSTLIAERPLAAGVLLAVGLVTVETLALYALERVASPVSLGVVYLLGVLLVSIGWGAALSRQERRAIASRQTVGTWRLTPRSDRAARGARRRGGRLPHRARAQRPPRATPVEEVPAQRIVAAAAGDGKRDGFSVDDIAWLLRNAPREVVVLRPDPTLHPPKRRAPQKASPPSAEVGKRCEVAGCDDAPKDSSTSSNWDAPHAPRARERSRRMATQIPPRGTRGAKAQPRGALGRGMMRVIQRVHRLTGSKMSGRPLLYLSTVGAKTGERRTSVVMPFPDGNDAWLIVASRGGTADHPSWYYNLVKHPDQVKIEIEGRTTAVTPRTLTGDGRAAAWKRITRERPNFAGYEKKTDREIPVVRLSAR